jgi:hypothetical protein
MSQSIDQLQRQMAAAAAALDFEEARRLRDQINLLRGGASPEEAARTDTAGLTRQRAGAMGIGTSVPKPIAPTDWKPPAKPDPMTTHRSRGRR